MSRLDSAHEASSCGHIARRHPNGPDGFAHRRRSQDRTASHHASGLFESDGRRWLFAQFGDVNWVRNLRGAGEVMISRGRRHQPISAAELSPGAAAHVLKYVVVPWLKGPMGVMATWMAGGPMFEVDPEAPASDFIKEVRRHPIFEVRRAGLEKRRGAQGGSSD